MTGVTDKEIFESLRRQEYFRRMRHLLDEMLGSPTWWICQKMSFHPKQIRQCMEFSFELWNDPKVKNWPAAKALFGQLQSKARLTHPFLFSQKKDSVGYCLPLAIKDRVIAYLLLTGLPKEPSEKARHLLIEYAFLVVDNVSKLEEVNRLSATIRPRAIALSTVHTVHRIINSTLNLDELVSRLAHLTAQVLRVQRCAIYLLDTCPSPIGGLTKIRRKFLTLVCKALVGYPKSKRPDRRIPLGRELEGRVAKSADIQLRKKVLCIPLIDEDVIGVVTVTGKKDKKDFNHFDLEILTTLAEEAVIAIKNAQLYEEQRRVTLSTIQSLAVVLSSRVAQNPVLSPEVFTRLAIRTARELKLTDEQVQALHYAALLKETTKIGISEEILKKSSKLTGEELTMLKKHPIQGARVVQNFESLKTVAPIILYSREKYDGTGYPEGLKAEAIPIGARILSVINAFEAIVVGRPYRSQSIRTDALQELQRNSGSQFDPRVVDAFIKIVKQEKIYKRLKNAGSK